MDCDRFLESRLDGSQNPEFREHLEVCGRCRGELEAYEKIRRLYREASSMERYRGGVPRIRRSWSAVWVPSLAAAVLLGVLVIALFGGPADLPRYGPRGGEPPVAEFSRVYLTPWNSWDSRWNEEARELWERLASFEGRRR